MIAILLNASLVMSLTLLTLGASVLPPEATPAANSRGEAWWTAWSSCDITPVWSAPEDGTDPAPAHPEPIGYLPWLKAETTNDSNATVVASLWPGSRPLPVHGSYTNGNNAKWLWILSDDLDDLTITASNEHGTRVDIDVGRVLSSSTGGNEWPSIIDLPEPGCWTFDIRATSSDGAPYEGRIVFPAVP